MPGEAEWQTIPPVSTSISPSPRSINQPHGTPGISPEVWQGIEERLAALEREVRDRATVAASSAATSPSKDDKKSEKFTVVPIGRIQADAIAFAHQNSASEAAYGDLQNYFEFRRLYLGVSGKGYEVLEYKLEVNFEPEALIHDRQNQVLAATDFVQLRDVYLGLNEVPIFQRVRFGAFKEPFCLEELTSSRFITFMERSLPGNLFAPKRKVGTAFMACPESEHWTLSSGVFFENVSLDTKELAEDRQGVEWALRATWNPIYLDDGRRVLHLGTGYVFTDDADNRLRYRTRPEVHESEYLLDTGVMLVDSLHRANLEAALVRGRFSIQSELFAVTTNSIANHPDFSFYGAYAMATWFLTGEHRPYERDTATFGRVVPNRNFRWIRTADPSRRGWGAWELGVRWSWVDLDEPALTSPLAGQLHDLTLGLTWYWNPEVKWTFQWIHAFGDPRNQPNMTHTDIVGLSARFDF